MSMMTAQEAAIASQKAILALHKEYLDKLEALANARLNEATSQGLKKCQLTPEELGDASDHVLQGLVTLLKQKSYDASVKADGSPLEISWEDAAPSKPMAFTIPIRR